LTGDDDPDRIASVREVLDEGIRQRNSWTGGDLAFWLWKLGELPETPEGIAEPYRLVMEGKPVEAATIWDAKGMPYERALALMHGDQSAQLEALEVLDTLGATAVAAKLRKALRDQGVSVPRRKSRMTRDHSAGLTARQAEVLQLLDEGLSNTEIADRLFVSSRTIENHVSAILGKLNSSTRQEAVTRARAEGLLTSNGPPTASA
jgi:DNA-binding CsgD family transcriptional regulator